MRSEVKQTLINFFQIPFGKKKVPHLMVLKAKFHLQVVYSFVYPKVFKKEVRVFVLFITFIDIFIQMGLFSKCVKIL